MHNVGCLFSASQTATRTPTSCLFVNSSSKQRPILVETQLEFDVIFFCYSGWYLHQSFSQMNRSRYQFFLYTFKSSDVKCWLKIFTAMGHFIRSWYSLHGMMAFFNIETLSPNVFLMSQDHDGTCFCEQCRTARLAGLSTKSIQLLRRDVMNSLPTQKKTKENTLFATTLKEIVAGPCTIDFQHLTTSHGKKNSKTIASTLMMQQYVLIIGIRSLQIWRTKE